MKLRNLLSHFGAAKGYWVSAGVLLIIALVLLLWPEREVAPGEADTKHDRAAATTELWTCAMHPHLRQHGPGPCPLCGMALVPVENQARADTLGDALGDTSGEARLRVTQAQRDRMRIRTHPVLRRFPTTEIRLFGEVDYDETRIAHIAAWAPGRIEALYGNFSGLRVRQGDHLARLYSPNLYAAQVELIEAVRMSAVDTLQAARDKLRRLGMAPEQILAVETGGEATEFVTMHAPIGGVVTERHVSEGAYLDTGDPILTLADLDKVWVRLDAYERDLQWLRYGQLVELSSEALPGVMFKGQVAFIDPAVDARTRTAKVRVNLDNAKGLLKPGMFMQARLEVGLAANGKVLDARLANKWISPMHPEIVKDGPGNCDVCGMALVPAETLGYAAMQARGEQAPLVVPASAVMLTGTRAIVYVEDVDAELPTYVGREVTLGPRVGDDYIVADGLHEGDQVVVEGNFKIDSALEIRGLPSLMSRQGAGGIGGHDHAGHVP